jgi:exodeoxyribonuclease VII large subunit
LLAALSRAPVEHLARERAGLRQATRELRAAARRQLGRERAGTLTRARALAQHRAAFARECQRRRPAEFEQLRLALMAHDPERTLARGYALAEDTSGEPLTSAAAARAAGHVTLRFADGRVGAQIESG